MGNFPFPRHRKLHCQFHQRPTSCHWKWSQLPITTTQIEMSPNVWRALLITDNKSIFDWPLMLQVNLPMVATIHSKNNNFFKGEKISSRLQVIQNLRQSCMCNFFFYFFNILHYEEFVARHWRDVPLIHSMLSYFSNF